jgi:hypothetical protein
MRVRGESHESELEDPKYFKALRDAVERTFDRFRPHAGDDSVLAVAAGEPRFQRTFPID